MFFCFYQVQSSIDKPFYRKISYLDGLPSGSIFNLHNGRDGYLYLGSTIGIIQYNGVTFNILPFKNALSTAVSDIREDDNGTIYCRSFSNQIFYKKNDTLHAIQEIEYLFSANNNLSGIATEKNNLWIASSKGVYKLNQSFKIDTIIESTQLSKEEEILDIVYNKEKEEVAIISTIMLYVYKNGKFEYYNLKEGNKRLAVHNGKYYYNLRTEVNEVLNLKNEKFTSTIDQKSTIYYHLASTDDFLWLCTTNGVYLLDTENSLIKKPLIKSGRISDVITDHEGNYWVSTLDEGIYFIPNLFINLFDFNSNIKLSEINYLRITEIEKNKLLVGTNYGQVYEIDDSGNLLLEYFSDRSYPIEFIYYHKPTKRILTSQGIFKRNEPQIKKKIYLGKDIASDNKNNFILSTFNQAILMNQDLENEPNFESTILNKGLYSDFEIPMLYLYNQRTRVSVFSERYHKYYISSATEGLMVMDTFGYVKRLLYEDGSAISVAKFQEIDGDIWIGSGNQGLLKIEDEQIVKQYNTLNGLSSNSVKSFCYANNNLWVVTTKGLNQVDLNKDEVLYLSPSFYLKNFNINDIATTPDNLWLSTNIGVFKFPFSELKPNFKTKLFFKDILVNRVSSNKKNLKYKENNLSFLFDAILFQSMGLHNFQYRLLGFDDEWLERSARENRLDFLNLKHGDYTLQLKVTLRDYESEFIEYSFTILKPFWLKSWFITLIILVFLIILFFVYQAAKQITRKEELILRKLALSQLTALRSQMNPHFMFNVLNSVQGLIYSNQKNKASEYLGKFSELMRKILNNSDKSKIDLNEEIETLKLYIELEAERFDEDFEYDIKIDEKLLNSDLKIPSMIVQPYIENAIKHGLLHKKGHKKLHVNFAFSEKKSFLAIIIEDNGVGREASLVINKNKQKHNSFATKAINRRIELLNKQLSKPIQLQIVDFDLEKDSKTGTKIILNIPIDYE